MNRPDDTKEGTNMNELDILVEEASTKGDAITEKPGPLLLPKPSVQLRKEANE